ncbi:NAD(P)-dependent oxidoreductase [Thalassococcus lentus]|uniref:SDR family oxidoreductase n=1 Tax=Thalassococcus lentus TaxID=1210524 RepID=A0ABT4XPV1_9RHOB|nr:NAD(P)-binding oxidoreductase [Thalassococcus lentus]MDA7423883.1 SDR family oxidoreductase [Thalassococcus lentus]
MHILVIGASRGIGKAVTLAALEAGHSVRAMSRTADTMDPAQGLEPFAGDATRAADLEKALQGVDAVVMALGIRETVAMLWKKVTLFSDATAALVPLMERDGPSRLICITGIGAGDSAQSLSSVERVGHKIVFSQPYRDKTKQEQIIKESALRWTLVRPTVLTNNKASGKYRVLTDPKDWRMGMISRADVADYVLKALRDDETIGTAAVLAR